MVTDMQVRRLMKLMNTEKTLKMAAIKAGMSEKTANKYIRLGKLPSQCKVEHTWKTRNDPFEEAWEELKEKLEINPGLQAKTLFQDLQRRFPGKYADGQIRTLQRKVKRWRSLEGPAKEVFFPQIHKPGQLCQSDFTHMSKLKITINGESFQHMLYHFVLTYSNWETGNICFSESFESLSEGIQNALWKLGGVPFDHQTDRLSSAVHKLGHPEEFTQRYKALLKHYGLNGRKIQAGKANENGDIEQRHRRFKDALDQALMLRGNRDFESREEYETFLQKLFEQLNAGRRDRLFDEMRELKTLPAMRLNDCKKLKVRVGPSSTIHVQHNTYSVHSRLIGEQVEVRLYADNLEIWYAQKFTETIPRIRGESSHFIQYRHIIDWLVRKPGAFENYRYRDDLFPTSRFRMAYDYLKDYSPIKANKEYLKILYLAAMESESDVDDVLRHLIYEEKPINSEAVQALMESNDPVLPATAIIVDEVDLSVYDVLLEREEALV